MIIRCPECSTGFKLPDERVTPEGTKLKCSRCEHVFRVREDAQGEVEFFYRSHDNKEKAVAAAAGGDNPFPHAGLDLKPKASSAFGGDDDAPSGGDADEEEASELQDVVEEPESEPEPEAERVEEKEAGLAEESSEGASTEPLTGSGSEFGDPQDHVDPSFGESGPVFDPEKGKVTPEEKPTQPEQNPSPGPKKKKGSGGPPVGAVGAPPTQMANSGPPTQQAGGPSSQPAAAQQPKSAPTPEVDQKPQPAASPDQWDEELEPHKIGGSTGQKVVTFLFLVLLVGAGFIGTVAALNDGFIDFKAFDEMLEVAFSDGEYEPRAEWTEDGPDVTIVENTEPVAVEGIYGEVISLGGDDEILVVQGIVRNHDDARLHELDLRGMITSVEGRSLREIVTPVVGDAPSIGEFRDLDSVEDVEELLGGGYATIESGDAVPFTMVFESVPQRVIDGERFSYRVEVID